MVNTDVWELTTYSGDKSRYGISMSVFPRAKLLFAVSFAAQLWLGAMQHQGTPKKLDLLWISIHISCTT